MSTKKIYKIILILFVGLFILGIGYVYTTIFGNPVVKLVAGHHIEKYVQLRYPENFSLGKIGYNFTTESYVTVLMDKNKKWYTDIHYYNNAVTDINEMEISDSKEEEILNVKLNNRISDLLEKMNFGFDNLMCNSSVCINANQKFESLEDLDRYDLASIIIYTKNEISKDVFAEMALDIIPEIKANMYYKEGSHIHISYQFEKQDNNYYIEFYCKESDMKITKEYIVDNTTIKTY